MNTSVHSNHDSGTETSVRGADIAAQRGKPSLKDPDYLMQEPRLRIVSEVVDTVKVKHPAVLDLGGRIQPYRPLFENSFASYIGVDPRNEGMVDVQAIGEQLPFKDQSFDVVLCTQVLSYSIDPQAMVNEIHRVLTPGGTVLLSAPSFFPMHEEERWRFLRGGLQQLFVNFKNIDIKAEGYSASGLCRTLNVGLNSHVKRYYSRYLVERLVYVPVNYVGKRLDKVVRGSERFTGNYTVIAVK